MDEGILLRLKCARANLGLATEAVFSAYNISKGNEADILDKLFCDLEDIQEHLSSIIETPSAPARK